MFLFSVMLPGFISGETNIQIHKRFNQWLASDTVCMVWLTLLALA
jgi:hypothetical protein